MKRTTMLWRRLDVPGHDACLFREHASGWDLEGTAVFQHQGGVACLTYRVAGDPSWRTERGSVHGFVGAQSVNVMIVRQADGAWTVNGELVPGLESCLHLDFGFTPATNFPQVRQLAPTTNGQTADLPAAWMDVPPSGLQLLPQRYERRSELTYWYEATTVPYAALLELTAGGFIQRYPDLWESLDITEA